MKKQILKAILPIALLSVSASSSGQTYKDVAHIFYARCTSCHHENQHAPSMMNYTETAIEARNIKNDLLSGRMPPWSPDTTYHRFLNERLITASEKTAILNWIAAGTQQGDTTQAPSAPVYTSQYLLQGVPDLILRIPTFPSNATASTDVYNCFALPSGLSADRIIRAYEIVPGNISIVHHVVVNIDSAGTVNSDLSGSCFMEPGASLGGYAPGSGPTIFPNGPSLRAGVKLKAGSKVILQIHYPAGTQGQKDSTQIRIFFYPSGTTGIRPMHGGTLLQNWTMSLPANKVTAATATYPSFFGIPNAWSVFAAFPHAHRINVASVDCAYSPWGTTDTVPLIQIKKWDFEFQGFYYFPRLVKIPQGYTLYAKHIYDNTTNNVANPNNPPVQVNAGTSTKDEMLFDSFMWLDYKPGDDTIDIGRLIDNDPLVTGLNQPANRQEQVQSHTYPNPFSESTTLVLEGADLVNTAELRLYDMFGKEVRREIVYSASGKGFVIHRSALPAGVYLYTIRAGRVYGSGKLMMLSE
jgi:hypothetical protein